MNELHQHNKNRLSKAGFYDIKLYDAVRRSRIEQA